MSRLSKRLGVFAEEQSGLVSDPSWLSLPSGAVQAGLQEAKSEGC